MTDVTDPNRRILLRNLALGLALVPLGAAEAQNSGADLSPLTEDDPKAKAVSYVEDAARAKGAAPGTNCSNCGLYSGKSGATQGTCATLFPGKLVKSAGWCSAWATL